MAKVKDHPTTVRGLKAEWKRLLKQAESAYCEIDFLNDEMQDFMSRATEKQYDTLITLADKIEALRDTLDDALIEARR